MAYKQLKLWFDADLAELLSDKLIDSGVDFDTSSFVNTVAEKLYYLELKDRVEWFAQALHAHLPDDYPIALQQLVNILGPKNEMETGMFKTYYWIMPIAKYVENYGLEHFDLSMEAIKEITQRNTGEYTVRPYLERYPEQTLELLLDWTRDSNKHVRRLCSEGVRPRLPWATKLDGFIKNPNPIFPILDHLKDDPSKYVQKSVANCVNDVLKDNPEIGMSWIEDWVQGAGKSRKWIIKHALRNLRKSNDPWAFGILATVS
nr:DNA alkylation repair protein [Allomuricauda sp.]